LKEQKAKSQQYLTPSEEKALLRGVKVSPREAELQTTGLDLDDT
jgi:hypothetical protein